MKRSFTVFFCLFMFAIVAILPSCSNNEAHDEEAIVKEYEATASTQKRKQVLSENQKLVDNMPYDHFGEFLQMDGKYYETKDYYAVKEYRKLRTKSLNFAWIIHSEYRGPTDDRIYVFGPKKDDPDDPNVYCGRRNCILIDEQTISPVKDRPGYYVIRPREGLKRDEIYTIRTGQRGMTHEPIIYYGEK